MRKRRQKRIITPELIDSYSVSLREQEKAPATIQKYTHDLNALYAYLPGGIITKTSLISWKEHLIEQYAATSVNAILAAANSFLTFCGWTDCRVKPLKIQRDLFCRADKELTRDEYERLVRSAENAGDRRLSLILQTICATGIRVSELQFITVEAAQTGRAEVCNKGKRRTIFLPEKLCRTLLKFIGKEKTAGAVFVTRSGKPVDRSNVWRSMKSLCESAGVIPEKVYPHNLRHLFARVFYMLQKDLSRLADILGHTNINTTRLYTIESGIIHARLIERMRLVIT